MNGVYRRVCFAVLAIALFALLTPAGVNAQTAPTIPSTQVLDSYFRRVSAGGFAGSVLIAHGDRVVLRGAYGFANEATKTPFTPETVVDIGSLTKQFTAAAILQLVEQKRLRTTDTLRTFFPTAPADRATITIHQLLTHTAGLRDVAVGDLTPLSRDDALGAIFALPLTAEPGREYRYCNACYTVLAAIIEQVAGQSFTAYLHSHLFAPVGMAHTGFYGEARWRGQVVANGYWNGADQGSPATWPGPYWAVMGNGGALSTVDDLARWWRALRTNQVLQPEQTAQLFARQVAQDSPDTFYGYGWGIEASPLGERITHNGGGIGGNSDLAYFGQADVLVILLGNRIVYRTLTEELPFEVRLFATDAQHQLAANIAAGDFERLPAATFAIPPLLVAGVVATILALGVLLVWVARRWRSGRVGRRQREPAGPGAGPPPRAGRRRRPS